MTIGRLVTPSDGRPPTTMIRHLRRLVPSGDVTERTVKSGVWLAGINVSNRLLQILMILVLTQLLGPAEFGLMGVALLVLSALKKFSQLGLDDALIQRREDDVDGLLNTAWTLQVVRGVALAGVTYALAPHAAALFGEPRVAPLLRFVAVTPVLVGLRNPGTVYLRKDLEYHRQAVLTLSETIPRVAVSVGYAFLVDPTAWALAVGFVVAAGVQTLTSFGVHGYRPRPGFDLGVARDLLDFGKWILLSGVVNFLFSEGDDVFVGWFFAVGALGIYQLAYRLSNAPATEVAHLVSQVTFPAYSKIQGSVDRLRTGYYRALQVTAVVSVPTGVGIVAVAPVFVDGALGPDWAEMVVPLQVLTVYGLARSLRSPTTALFKSVGRPDLLTKLQAMKLSLLALCIYPAAETFGLVGVAAVVVCNELLAMPLAHLLALRIVEGGLRDPLAILAYPLLGSAIMGAVVVGLREQLRAGVPLLELALLVAAGVVVYALTMAALERRFQFGMADLVGTIRRGLA